MPLSVLGHPASGTGDDGKRDRALRGQGLSVFTHRLSECKEKIRRGDEPNDTTDCATNRHIEPHLVWTTKEVTSDAASDST
jgi:hypothetical protein